MLVIEREIEICRNHHVSIVETLPWHVGNCRSVSNNQKLFAARKIKEEARRCEKKAKKGAKGRREQEYYL